MLPQVLESCPWVQPRTLSVLAVVDASGEAATVFTMHTSVRRKSMEAELTKVRYRVYTLPRVIICCAFPTAASC